MPSIPIFANSQIMRPAGAATQMALPSTKIVLSKIKIYDCYLTINIENDNIFLFYLLVLKSRFS